MHSVVNRLLVLLAALACCSPVSASIDRGAPLEPQPLVREADPPLRSIGDCKLGPEERALAELLLRNESQKRPRLVCDSQLHAFARARAEDIAQRDYFGHVTPENIGPNDLLRGHGFPLPGYYGRYRGNNVEALAGGIDDAAEVLRMLLDSRPHRAHLLGDDGLFLEQDRFGVAYYRELDSPHVDHWVIIIARKAGSNEPHVVCEPPPGGCFVFRSAAAKADANSR